MDVYLPPTIPIRSIRWGTIPAAAQTANVYTGKTKARALGGDRLSCTIDFSITTEQLRAQLLAFLAELRGPINTALIADPGYSPRGSYSTSELLPNTEFSSTTGLSAGSEASLSVSDGVLRVLRTSNPGSLGVNHFASMTVGATVQWQAYAFRLHARRVRGVANINPNVTGNAISFKSTGESSYLTAPGYSVNGVMASDTSGITAYFDNIQPGESMAGEFFEIDFASFAPCALIDAGTNLLLRSDELDNTAAWGTLPADGIASVSANAVVAPDGTTTADTLVEDTNNGNHVRDQAVAVGTAAGTYCFAVAVKAGTRGFVQLVMNHATGSVGTYFNLTTGAVATGPTGSGWLNQRAYSRDLGNGWWYLCVIARKTSSDTSISPAIYIANSISNNSYLGNGSTIHAWRATFANSPVPVRLIETAGAASPIGNAQRGTEIQLKGLPVSTQNIRKVNDWVEFNSNGLVMRRQLVSPLHSDAAGLGTLFLSQPVNNEIADNWPVILHNPLARMRCVSEIPSWLTEPGKFSTASIDFEESANA